MGLSAILKKVVHSKSASQSSSNGDTAAGRTSVDSPSGPRSEQYTPRKSLDPRQQPIDSAEVGNGHQSLSSPSRTEPSSTARQPMMDFEPPHHAPPRPPPKETATPPQLATPEFKPFSVPSHSSNPKTANKSDLPFESTNKASAAPDVTFEGHPFPSNTFPAPKTIDPPPRSPLPAHTIPTEPTGAINPSYLSHTESIYAPTPYTPAQHLAYHVGRLPPTTFVPAQSRIVPSTVSHQQQRLDLADKIKRDHHPKKTPLGAKGVELFAKAGMTVHDPEGKGTIDWTEHWLEAVVQEHVIPHEHRIYKTVINREIHRYHI